MEKIKVKIGWAEKNYAAVTDDDRLNGIIITTHKTYNGLVSDIYESLEEHTQYRIEDGEDVPEWLKNKEYELEIEYSASALIRRAEEYTSLSAISKASGINLQQLSHYANGFRSPRPDKVVRIREAIHKIGQELLAI